MAKERAISTPLISEATLKSHAEVGIDLPGELLSIFEDETPKSLQRIHEALAKGDSRLVGDESHGLKGSCASIGALRMSSLALQMQNAGRAGNLADFEPLVKEMEEVYQETLPALKSCVEDIKKTPS